MKLGTLFIIVGIIIGIIHISTSIIADYNYNNKIKYAWNLADKSSTLEAKAGYISEFLTNLEHAKLSEYNAIFLKTPNNNIQKNIEALKTLKTRLDEIKNLDVESFAYQTAIQQITAQEQGEAQEMLYTINGGWDLANYPIVWGWICIILVCIWVILIVGGFMMNFADRL